MFSPSIYLMIESGEPLALVKQHIADKVRAHEDAVALAKELKCDQMQTGFGGTLYGVVFKHAVPPDWTKPDRKNGVSRPKRGTYWAARLAEQKAVEMPTVLISEKLSVPTHLSWKSQDGSSHGGGCIGMPLRECGFLWLSPEGPFCMWIPDVEAAVKQHLERGDIVEEPAASFRPNIPGTRRIEKEEWEILVLQHNLSVKQAAALEA